MTWLAEGKALRDEDGVQHVSRAPGEALCGERRLPYDLQWQTRTVTVCTPCMQQALRLLEIAKQR